MKPSVMHALRLLLAGLVLFSAAESFALPKYSFRSSRLCDNCHSTPFKNTFQKEWENPELSKRKCNMSCQSCHINPGGGGIRNVAGRYYGLSTLPMFGYKFRPYHDKIRVKSREVGSTNLGVRDDFNQQKDQIRAWISARLNGSGQSDTEPAAATPADTENSAEKDGQAGVEAGGQGSGQFTGQKAQLSAAEAGRLRKLLERLDQIDLNNTSWPVELVPYYTGQASFEPHFYYPDDFLSYGAPLDAVSIDEQSPYAFDRDRFGSLNADPFVTIGADFRPSYVAAGEAGFFFPMQAETGAAIHPVEHLTIAATGALQGRAEGPDETLREPVKLQTGFVMLHELPYQSYLMAGWFVPEFGLRVEDHTSFTRRPFEMDPSRPQNIVQGVQWGLAPNYPYASGAVFQTRDADGNVDGSGYNITAAWRGIEWGLGASMMQKFRDFDVISETGDLSAVSLNGYYNLWHLFPKMRYTNPVLIQADYSLGFRSRTAAQSARFISWLWQVDYLVYNGLNLRANLSFYDADTEIADNALYRAGLGYDLTLFPGMRWTTELHIPVGLAGGGEGESTFLTFLHLYL